ncbi:Ceramidase [Handroanthus impetiginosus]|uniref:Neutral ceramidase n=1 Tax=Handroanthus impetiginosus TaxID=429701 RepID=A0A2G9H3F6_9LAMI|nr:Ceramidase [Handroanthus impetiginosus]
MSQELCRDIRSRMYNHQLLTSILISLCLILCSPLVANGDYLIGVGSYDMTGPAAGVNMMGYANMEQVTGGIHFRLRARTFIVAESKQGPRIAFVNLDAGMASQLVTIKVLERLKSRYGDLYNEDNVAISGTHTHAGPGGYLQYGTYSTAQGFVPQSFDALVTAIELSLAQAHDNLKPGSIFNNTGDLENGGINRSPSAYLFNPPEERAKYARNVDTQMTILKFVDKNCGKSIGAFSWFATHGTSMSRNNKLISGDNKGAAARFFEDWFMSSSSSFSTSRHTRLKPLSGALVRKASRIKATGGDSCSKADIQSSKVRQNNESRFVGAFCQSNVGDVSPNVLGAFCLDSGKPCDFNHSSCHGNDQLCVARGPGYPDEILSTKIIGERQFQKAVHLFTSAEDEITGKIDYQLMYLNFTDIAVVLDGNQVVKTCPAALGPGFAAGTTDGPGLPGFQQGDTKISEFWKKLRDAIQEPSQYQVECQKPKTVLLDTGEMFSPYAWAPAILPIQILRLGKLVILSVPGEFTTMAGRRLREAVKETLISNGNGEFNNDTHIVIAGLTNAYSQYVATFEEYKQQRYEAASTLYGPHTLSAYIQEFKKLAQALARGDKNVARGPSPPDLSSVLTSLLTDPSGDSPPPGVKFGDMKNDIKNGPFKVRDRVNATFWSANPRYDLLTEGTFSAVEILRGNKWISAYDDDDLCLFFKWDGQFHKNGSYGVATIEWEVPEEASAGVYRLRHFGSFKTKKDSPISYFTGASSGFAVIKK